MIGDLLKCAHESRLVWEASYDININYHDYDKIKNIKEELKQKLLAEGLKGGFQEDHDADNTAFALSYKIFEAIKREPSRNTVEKIILAYFCERFSRPEDIERLLACLPEFLKESARAPAAPEPAPLSAPVVTLEEVSSAISTSATGGGGVVKRPQVPTQTPESPATTVNEEIATIGSSTSSGKINIGDSVKKLIIVGEVNELKLDGATRLEEIELSEHLTGYGATQSRTTAKLSTLKVPSSVTTLNIKRGKITTLDLTEANHALALAAGSDLSLVTTIKIKTSQTFAWLTAFESKIQRIE